ncbi:MAG: hypothetical protein FWF81_15005 [Defluviitaleaceae bacterium]|nr:hypothetical protein [Defluviitaleaceae bacterium]
MKIKINRAYPQVRILPKAKSNPLTVIPPCLYSFRQICGSCIFHVYAIGETHTIGGFTVSKHSKRITFCVLAGETPDPKT